MSPIPHHTWHGWCSHKGCCSDETLWAANPYSGLLHVLDTTTFDSEQEFMDKYGDLKQAEEVGCTHHKA